MKCRFVGSYATEVRNLMRTASIGLPIVVLQFAKIEFVAGLSFLVVFFSWICESISCY